MCDPEIIPGAEGYVPVPELLRAVRELRQAHPDNDLLRLLGEAFELTPEQQYDVFFFADVMLQASGKNLKPRLVEDDE